MASSASKGLSSTKRISTCSNSSMRLLLGQSEVESRAFAGFAFCPYAPAVPRDDLVDQSEAHSRAGKLVIVVQTLEDSEQTRAVVGVEAGSVIADEIKMLAFVAETADLDLRVIFLRREL